MNNYITKADIVKAKFIRVIRKSEILNNKSKNSIESHNEKVRKAGKGTLLSRGPKKDPEEKE